MHRRKRGCKLHDALSATNGTSQWMSSTTRRTQRLWLVVACELVQLAVWSGASQTFRLGVVAPLTGRDAWQAQDVVRGTLRAKVSRASGRCAALRQVGHDEQCTHGIHKKEFVVGCPLVVVFSTAGVGAPCKQSKRRAGLWHSRRLRYA